MLVLILERMSSAILKTDISLEKYEFCNPYKKNKLAFVIVMAIEVNYLV